MKRIRLAAVFLSLVFVLSSCSMPVNFNRSRKPVISVNKEVLTEKEVKICALNYKCQFEDYYKELYGEDFWRLPVTEEIDYEAYVKEYFIFKELNCVLRLCAMSQELNVSVTQAETERLREASIAWEISMTEDEKAYTGASSEDIYNVLFRYLLAEKTVEKLMEGQKAEVSEEESRVADIQVIRLNTASIAFNVKNRLDNGESFMTLANDLSLDNKISYSVARGELIPDLDTVVFSLKDNEISDVIFTGENYYIIRMENMHDVLLSGKNRENLLAEKQYLLWKPEYDRLSSAMSTLRDKAVWDSVSLSQDGDYRYHSLFAYFGQ